VKSRASHGAAVPGGIILEKNKNRGEKNKNSKGTEENSRRLRVGKKSEDERRK